MEYKIEIFEKKNNKQIDATDLQSKVIAEIKQENKEIFLFKQKWGIY